MLCWNPVTFRLLIVQFVQSKRLWQAQLTELRALLVTAVLQHSTLVKQVHYFQYRQWRTSGTMDEQPRRLWAQWRHLWCLLERCWHARPVQGLQGVSL